MNGHQLYMSLTLALALVAIVLLATLTDGTHVVTVIAFLGGWVMPSPKGGGGGRRPPPPAAVLTLALFVSSLLVGCGPSALELHARVAGALHESSITAGEAIREARSESMRSAARAVHDAGGDETAALAAADAEARSWEDAIAAQRAFAIAVSGYVRIVLMDAAGSADLDLGEALELLRDGAAMYSVLQDLMESHGAHALPLLPEPVRLILGGDAR